MWVVVVVVVVADVVVVVADVVVADVVVVVVVVAVPRVAPSEDKTLSMKCVVERADKTIVLNLR